MYILRMILTFLNSSEVSDAGLSELTEVKNKYLFHHRLEVLKGLFSQIQTEPHQMFPVFELR